MKAKKNAAAAGLAAGTVLLILMGFTGVDALPQEEDENSMTGVSVEAAPEMAVNPVMTMLKGARYSAGNTAEQEGTEADPESVGKGIPAPALMPLNGIAQDLTVPENTETSSQQEDGSEIAPQTSGEMEEAGQESADAASQSTASDSGESTPEAGESIPESTAQEAGEVLESSSQSLPETQEASETKESGSQSLPETEEALETEESISQTQETSEGISETEESAAQSSPQETEENTEPAESTADEQQPEDSTEQTAPQNPSEAAEETPADSATETPENPEEEQWQPDRDYFENQFIVTVEGKTALNVREEPDAESKWVGKMYTGSGGEIVETGDGWTKIRSGKVTGWVSNDYILTGETGKQKTEELCELVFEVESDALKVRSAPTTEEENKLRAIYGGESYTVKGTQNGWVEIEYSEGKTGWVKAEYGTIRYSYDYAMSRAAIEEAEAAKKRAKTGKTSRAAKSASADDLTLLACLIQCESGSYEGQLAVANVILNRVNSSKYPNSIRGVIYAAGQFSPASSGKLAARLERGPSDTALQAASDALAGVNNVGSFLHFRSARTADVDSYSSYTVIAGNCFYSK